MIDDNDNDDDDTDGGDYDDNCHYWWSFVAAGRCVVDAEVSACCTVWLELWNEQKKVGHFSQFSMLNFYVCKYWFCLSPLIE